MLTPGATVRRQLGQHLADQPPGLAHPLELRRRPADNHRALPPPARSPPVADGFDRRRQIRRHAIGRLRPVDRPERRPRAGSTRPAASVCALVHLQPLPHDRRRCRRLRCTSRPPHAGTRAPPAPLSVARLGVRAAVLADHPRRPAAAPAPPPARRCRRTISGSRPSINRVERLGLRHRARKPVEDEPGRARPAGSSRSRTMPIITSSLTSSPRSMIALHALADLACRRAPLRAGCRRSRSSGIPRARANRSACVPFPAPGGPSMIRFSATRLAPPSANPRLLHEAVVVPHDQLRLDLLHRVHRHADDDQQRRAAEEERARPCPR